MNLRHWKPALAAAALATGALGISTPAVAATPDPALHTAPSTSAGATAFSSLPDCHAGTDGGRRGILNCYGGAGHVRLVTHCRWAPWADSGWMWDGGGHFYYPNTCLFGADEADAYVMA